MTGIGRITTDFFYFTEIHKETQSFSISTEAQRSGEIFRM